MYPTSPRYIEIIEINYDSLIKNRNENLNWVPIRHVLSIVNRNFVHPNLTEPKSNRFNSAVFYQTKTTTTILKSRTDTDPNGGEILRDETELRRRESPAGKPHPPLRPSFIVSFFLRRFPPKLILSISLIVSLYRGKTSLLFQFALNVATSSTKNRVVFICHRKKIESNPPFLSQVTYFSNPSI